MEEESWCSDEASFSDESSEYADEDYDFYEEEGRKDDHALDDTAMYDAFDKMELSDDIIEEDDDDSLGTVLEPYNPAELNNDIPSRLAFLKSPEPLSPLQKRDSLKSIRELKDQVLQMLLWHTGFRFLLHEHQFEAARKVAGLPKDFPLHYGSTLSPFFQHEVGPDDLVAYDEHLSFHDVVSGLSCPDSRGFCLGDAMGLGKTVESIAGAMLKSAVGEAQSKIPRPTLIISPNDAVQEQWYETLFSNGLSHDDIVLFRKDMDGSAFLGTSKFVLLTRHTAMAHFKSLFHNSDHQFKGEMSALFPKSHRIHIQAMYNEKLVEKGVQRSSWKKDGERHEDTITRIAKDGLKCKLDDSNSFQLILVDEAHFLKNRLTFATMACILSCANAERVVPLTGTPYNNGIGDLATIMTLIDPSERQSSSEWWQKKIDEGTVRDKARKWREKYLFRREKKAIEHLLPEKRVSSLYRVKTTFADLDIVYIKLEKKLQEVSTSLARLMNDPDADQNKLKGLRQAMLSIASQVRMANIHPLLPDSGREITMLFSPTRRKMITGKDRPLKCVCCKSNGNDMRRTICQTENKQAFIDITDTMEELTLYNDEDTVENYNGDSGIICTLPKHLCNGQHRAHPHCMKSLGRENKFCPRCQDLTKRRKSHFPCHKQFYCKNVVLSMPEGFAASPKLQEVIKFIEKRKTDKVIIVSYFKGALDLIEGILHFDLKYACSSIARFDGDISSKEQRNKELTKFKTNKRCRFLLMTAQSGGVGLNLTEARRLVMLDRWWNPFVNEQVEDRIHRLGQENDVEIRYFDTAGTIDEVLIKINEAKKMNSEMLIEDWILDGKTNKSQSARENAYRELAGSLGRLIDTIQKHRAEQYDVHIKRMDGDPHVFEIPMIRANVLRSSMTPKKTPVTKNTPIKISSKKAVCLSRQKHNNTFDAASRRILF